MISYYDKCLYIHIPKTAGQSIESVFLQRAGLSWEQRSSMLLKSNSNPQKGPPRLAHLTAREYLDYGYLTPKEFNKLFRFTFVRNPWDRLVSEYRYKQHKYSFKDFLFKHFPEKNIDDYRHHNGIYRHVMPQYKFIYNDKGKCLVNFVGKFENIDEDFAIVSNMICQQRLSLPHKNKTSAKGINSIFKRFTKTEKNKIDHYRSFYDSESKEFVEMFYQQDIELFDYTF